MKSTAVQIPSAQRCFLYFYSARSIGRYAESPFGNSSPVSAKPFFSQNALLCGLPRSTARRTFLQLALAQFVQQFADQRRADAAPLRGFLCHKKAEISCPLLRVIQNEIQHGNKRFSVEKAEVVLIRRVLSRRQRRKIL